MTYPKTLLQMANAPQHFSPLNQSILLVIDHQKEYTEGQLKLPDIEPAIKEIDRLLRLARKTSTPIIHVRHLGDSSMFDVNGRTGQFIDGIGPEGEEWIVGKTFPNAFTQTHLQDLLKKTGRNELIVAGFMTHMCVSSTVRSALDHGYRSTIVTDATATRDLPDKNGTVVSAADLKRVTLAGLSDRFAILVPNVNTWS